MKIVLAEKPSVARDIAAVLGASTKREGYLEGNGWFVTYAFGHLVKIAEPEDMNTAWGKPWRIEQLPMLPAEWKYRVDEKAAAQFKVIKKLFCDPGTTSIVCATDAGREGEHIFRLIYQLTGCKKPVERLWISSLTADAIKDGFRKLTPAKEFDNLADAASGRAHADWIVGLNFTRAYTVLNSQLCTVGRVQTPTLAMIVERQESIDNFKPEAFFEVLVTFEPGFLARYITPESEPQTRLKDKAQAQKILADIMPQPAGTVAKIETAEKKTKAPALYDLLTLQKDANRRHGYTAQETLDLAQSLYEQYKVTSYPRTESRHLSTDMVGELPRILSTVLQAPTTTKAAQAAFAKEGLNPGNITVNQLQPRLSKTYVDDTKLTDHHAIIPTHKTPPADLPAKERNIFELVATRFLAIFLPAEIRDETEAILQIASHSFRARGVVIKDPGWTVLEPKENQQDKEDGKAEDAQQLPPLQKGQQVPKRKQELKDGKTTPPKPFDDSSLLTAMKTAGKHLDDEELASHMKESGLGTPATRAQIIERLVQSGYVERKKKAILPTQKGKALIAVVHPSLKNVALTAGWEQQLSDMIDGKTSLSSYENHIAGFVRQLLPEVTRQGAAMPAQADTGLGTCPKCKQGTRARDSEGRRLQPLERRLQLLGLARAIRQETDG
jgi:DNA topoisomerase-3